MIIVEFQLPFIVARNDAAILTEATKFEGVDEAHIGHEGAVAGRRRELFEVLKSGTVDESALLVQLIMLFIWFPEEDEVDAAVVIGVPRIRAARMIDAPA